MGFSDSGLCLSGTRVGRISKMAGSFMPQRLYISLSEPIDTTGHQGAHEDRDACFAVREQTRRAIESQLGALRVLRDEDPGRYPAGASRTILLAGCWAEVDHRNWGGSRPSRR